MGCVKVAMTCVQISEKYSNMKSIEEDDDGEHRDDDADNDDDELT